MPLIAAVLSLIKKSAYTLVPTDGHDGERPSSSTEASDGYMEV